jgi:hypothetical protein
MMLEAKALAQDLLKAIRELIGELRELRAEIHNRDRTGGE